MVLKPASSILPPPYHSQHCTQRKCYVNFRQFNYFVEWGRITIPRCFDLSLPVKLNKLNCSPVLCFLWVTFHTFPPRSSLRRLHFPRPTNMLIYFPLLVCTAASHVVGVCTLENINYCPQLTFLSRLELRKVSWCQHCSYSFAPAIFWRYCYIWWCHIMTLNIMLLQKIDKISEGMI